MFSLQKFKFMVARAAVKIREFPSLWQIAVDEPQQQSRILLVFYRRQSHKHTQAQMM